MHDLGTLGGTNSRGYDLTDAGHVVGTSDTTATGDARAFFYAGAPGAGGAMINLDVWLDANNATEGAKWTLLDAVGVSDSGWITGIGTYDPDGLGGKSPHPTAYLLDASTLVPEPASISVLILGAIGTVLRRRGR
jgi:uncharacterized membrane protein